MGTEPIPRLLLHMSLPIALSMLVQSLYNIVDSIFVAHINEQALTAVTMAFPLQQLMNAVAVGTAVGMNALLSRSLGEQEYERANITGQTGLLLAVFSSILFIFIGLFVAPRYFAFQTADPLIQDYGTTYLRLVNVFSIGIFIQIIAERLLQSTGRSTLSMATQMVGAIFNIIFDPLLIFGIGPFPELGIVGAAIATFGGQWVGALLGLYLNFRKNPELDLKQRGFKLKKGIIKEIYKVGLPTTILISVNSLTVFAINNIINKFSTTAVAAYGVFFKLQSFIVMPIFGLNNGMVSIIGYNYGAGYKDRIYEVIKTAIKAAAIFMITGVLILQIFPEQLLSLFNPTPELQQISIDIIRRTSLALIIASFSIVSLSAFQALGNGVLSMVVTLIRQLVVLVPVAYLLSKTGKLKLVWWAQPISEVVALFIAYHFLKVILKNKVDPLVPIEKRKRQEQ